MGYSPWGHKESDTTERLHECSVNTMGIVDRRVANSSLTFWNLLFFFFFKYKDIFKVFIYLAVLGLSCGTGALPCIMWDLSLRCKGLSSCGARS